MSFEFIRKLPTPEEIKENFPLSNQLKELKKSRDEEIKKFLPVKATNFLLS